MFVRDAKVAALKTEAVCLYIAETSAIRASPLMCLNPHLWRRDTLASVPSHLLSALFRLLSGYCPGFQLVKKGFTSLLILNRVVISSWKEK